MPIVSMPDGTRVAFPDQMPPDQIAGMIRQKFPQEVAGLNSSDQSSGALDTAMGLAKAAGSGVAKGVAGLVGLPGTLDELTTAAVAKLIPEGKRQAFYDLLNANRPLAAPSAQTVQGGIEKVTGPLYQPQTTPEKYVSNVAEFAPGVVAGPGGLARRAITQAVIPGVASEAAGQATEGTGYEPVARAAAAMLSPIAAERALTPLTTPAGRRDSVQFLRNEGVDVTAGQSSGNKYLRKQEEELGGSTTQVIAERQAEQFTSAALRRVGEDAQRATPEVVDGAFRRIGDTINNLARNNTLTMDGQFAREARTAIGNFNDLVPPALRPPLVARIERAIAQQPAASGTLPANTITGEQYQSLRSRLGSLARGLTRDPEQQRAVYQLQNALDDAMERSIQATNPNALGEWQQARTEYRNLLAIEKAVSYSGEAAASGIVTPQNLARAVKTVQGMRNYTRGRGELQQLARAGAEVMTPLANSNTASRLMTNIFLHGVGSALGGTAGSVAGPGGTVAGAIAGAALPRAIGEGLIRGRRALGNTLIQERQTPAATLTRGLIGALGR